MLSNKHSIINKRHLSKNYNLPLTKKENIIKNKMMLNNENEPSKLYI